ncbi:hypothetical protein BOX15_Mlig024163g3, partial [Macrostomum lignano]
VKLHITNNEARIQDQQSSVINKPTVMQCSALTLIVLLSVEGVFAAIVKAVPKGCYLLSDELPPVLELEVAGPLAEMSQATCMRECLTARKSKPFNYFGIADHRWCYCGDRIVYGLPYQSADLCNVFPCVDGGFGNRCQGFVGMEVFDLVLV